LNISFWYIYFYNIIDLIIGLYITKYYIKNIEYIGHHIATLVLFFIIFVYKLNSALELFLIAETSTIFNYLRLEYKTEFFNLFFGIYFIIVRTFVLIKFLNLKYFIIGYNLYSIIYITFVFIHLKWFYQIIIKMNNHFIKTYTDNDIYINNIDINENINNIQNNNENNNNANNIDNGDDDNNADE
jgi:hypothetical protein